MLTHFYLCKLESSSDRKKIRIVWAKKRTLRGTYRQPRPPPRNVMLSLRSATEVQNANDIAYRFEYSPGMRAFTTVSGSGLNHRSGFHSCASSPHTAVFVFDASIEIYRFVPSGTNISLIGVPSLPVIGVDRGISISLRAL